MSVELTHFYARRIVDFTIQQNLNLRSHHKLILENNLNMLAPPEVALSVDRGLRGGQIRGPNEPLVAAGVVHSMTFLRRKIREVDGGKS